MAVAAMAEQRKPLILPTTLPGGGHPDSLLRIADGLIRKGYQVAFIVSSEYQDKIIRLNAEYVHTLGPFDLVSKGLVERQWNLSTGFQRAFVVQKTLLVKPLSHRARIIGETLSTLRERNPSHQIIFVADTASAFIHPFKRGRKLPPAFVSQTIGISIAPLYLQGIDTAPFTLALPPNSTLSGRLRNLEMYKLMLNGPWKQWRESHTDALLKAVVTSLRRLPHSLRCLPAGVLFFLVTAKYSSWPSPYLRAPPTERKRIRQA